MSQVQQLVDMGFAEEDVRRVCAQVGNNMEQAIERLLSGNFGGSDLDPPRLTGAPFVEDDTEIGPAKATKPDKDLSDLPATRSETPGVIGPPLPPIAEDAELNAALEASMRTQSDVGLPIPEAARENGLPCGLRNVGNTCYVNSLLQTLLHVDEFRDRMLRYRSGTEFEANGSASASGEQAESSAATGAVMEPESEDGTSREAVNASRRRCCMQLALELRKLYAYSLFSLRGCIDPSRLLNEIVDNNGQKLRVGNQEDVGEFMLKFMDRLEEGLGAGAFFEGNAALVPDAASGSAPSAAPVQATPLLLPPETNDQPQPVEEPALPDDEARPAPAAETPVPDGEAGPSPDSDPSVPVFGGGAPDTEPPSPGDGASAVPRAEPTTPVGVFKAPPPPPESPPGPTPLLSQNPPGLPSGPPPPDAGSPPPAADAVPAGDATMSPDTQKEKEPSPLQTLFFGRQVQIFSYTEGSSSNSGAANLDVEACASDKPKDAAATEPPAENAADAAESSPCSAAEPSGEPPPDEPNAEPQGENDGGSGKQITSEEKCDFLQIFLDVKHKDLYTAWEAANNTEVEYTTPNGSTTTATTCTWIERLPKLLFFQLQRVIFDQEKKTQVKIDEEFAFDSTIYADRFLFTNRDRATEAAARVRQLRNRRGVLQEALRRFEDFRGRPGLHADEVLGWAAECMETNASSASASSDQALERCDPSALCGAGLSQASELPNALRAPVDGGDGTVADLAVRLLRGLQEQCRTQAEILRNEIASIEKCIEEAHSDLREQQYELHSIWAHQGIAGSGHYWAYIRDWPNDRWYRFDDTVVTIVDWEDVQKAALGKAGSNTSAYVLVYLDKESASTQATATDEASVLERAEASVPPQLLEEIRRDNEVVKIEQTRREERLFDQELRQHGEAIFQHYAGLIHHWDPKKRVQDTVGNPHDAHQRKNIYDSALLCFELFLYRWKGEQEVWTYFIGQSIEAARVERGWKPEDEGTILYYLHSTLRSQKCYAQMLKDVTPVDGPRPQYEFQPLQTQKLMAVYNVVLTQAHVEDEALQMLQADPSKFVEAIGAFALVWVKLEADDRFRQNEVLLVMSTLIYHLVGLLELHKKHLSDAALLAFQPSMEYFALLLAVVEWPKSWKNPLLARIQSLFPQLQPPRSSSHSVIGQQVVAPSQEDKDMVMNHPITQQQTRLEEYELRRPQPSQEFFERHRRLYCWAMESDQAIAREFILSKVPALREQLGGVAG